MATFSLPRFQKARLEIEQARKLKRIIDEAADEQPLERGEPLTKPGDFHLLRGIPMLAKSVGGTIPGTQPEQACVKKLMKQRDLSDLGR